MYPAFLVDVDNVVMSAALLVPRGWEIWLLWSSRGPAVGEGLTAPWGAEAEADADVKDEDVEMEDPWAD